MDCPVCGDRMEFSHISDDGEMCVYMCRGCGTERETPLMPDEDEFRELIEEDQDDETVSVAGDDVDDWL
jgi:uncharacterized Zn finger protein